MPERIRFHFDPLCPWCYQTSRWVRQLERLGEVEADWGVFSLELVNAGSDESQAKGHGRSAAALRTSVVVRDKEGPQAVGRFYAELGAAVHERGEAVADHGVLQGSLAAAGLDTELLDVALDDDDSWAAVEREHNALCERTRSFGVPTIVLDGGEGPAIFGPVVSEVPTDTDAVELWRHVAWLIRYENFSELKRDRTIDPDLETIRRSRARQREQAAG